MSKPIARIAQPTTYRFRDRLPAAGEGKAPRAELSAVVGNDGVGRLYLYDVIDSWGGYWGTSASEVALALGEIGNDVTDLHVHINSPGGEVYEAIAIKNLLAAHPAKVTAVVDGIAASAASFIAASADELVMGDNTELMIHDAMIGIFGNAADHRAYADDLDRVSDNIASIYATKAGGDVADWRATMIAERWYSAQESVDAGLADRVGLEQANTETPDQAAARIQTALVAMGAKATSRATAGAAQPAVAPSPEPEPTPAADRSAALAALAARHSFRERAQRR